MPIGLPLNGYTHPVLGGIDELDPGTRRLDGALFHELAPPQAERLAIAPDFQRRGGCRGDFDVSRTSACVRRFAPPLERIGQEGFRTLLWQRPGLGGNPAVNGDRQTGRTVSVLWSCQRHADRAPGSADERRLVEVPEGYGGH